MKDLVVSVHNMSLPRIKTLTEKSSHFITGMKAMARHQRRSTATTVLYTLLVKNIRCYPAIRYQLLLYKLLVKCALAGGLMDVNVAASSPTVDKTP